MKYLSLFILLAGIHLSTSCDKEPETGGPDPPPDTLLFEGVKLFDINGAPIGCYQDCADDVDWTNNELSAIGMFALDFGHEIELGSDEAYTVERLFGYPIPIGNNGDLTITAFTNGEAVLKIALLNKTQELVFQEAFKITPDLNSIRLSTENFTNIPRKEIHRLFYSVETSDGNKLFRGYGDIAVCTEDANPTLDTCF